MDDRQRADLAHPELSVGLRIAIAGGPGVGKTTLIEELAQLGYPTVRESAREFIRERLGRGEPPRPDPATFAQEILRRDIEKYRASASLAGPVFFDRTAVEAIAMLHEAAAIDGAERDRLLSTYRFHAPVFVLPPWREIYVMDAERDQPFDGADAIHLLTLDCYGRAGYAVALVPLASPQERAQFVLRALALD